MNNEFTGDDIAAGPAGHGGELHKESEGEIGETEREEGGSDEMEGNASE